MQLDKERWLMLRKGKKIVDGKEKGCASGLSGLYFELRDRLYKCWNGDKEELDRLNGEISSNRSIVFDCEDFLSDPELYGFSGSKGVE